MLAQELDFQTRLEAHVHGWLHSDGGRADPHADLIALAPELFHLACRLVADADVPAEERARLGAAIAYFVIPSDIIPEALAGPRGYLDDVAITAAALSKVAPVLLERHWRGEGSAAEAVRTVLARAEEALGDHAIWRKLRSLLE